MLGWRSLKQPAMPDRALPDYDGQCRRFWEQSEVWWDNWAHNFVLSVVVFPLLGTVVGILLLLIR